jgi:transposase-like protein
MEQQMSNEGRQAANEAMRKWRQKNPDKIRQYNITYWERKAREGQNIKSRVIHLHEIGYSLREIGQELNISHMTVKRMLQDVTEHD